MEPDKRNTITILKNLSNSSVIVLIPQPPCNLEVGRFFVMFEPTRG